MSIEKSPRVEEVERSMEATRGRMAATVAELDEVVSARVATVKEKVDVRRYVADYPWPALLVAVGAGILLARSGADERAASAVRRAPALTKRGVARAAGAVRDKIGRKGSGHEPAGDQVYGDATTVQEHDGLAWRVTTAVHGDRLLDEMRTEADRIGGTAAHRPSEDERAL